MPKVIKICFVCLGNIVRSPLAENLFRSIVEASGVGSKYEIRSAATSNWHVGEEPDRRMRRVAARYGFNYSGQARQFLKKDLDYFDFIIAMDKANRDSLLRMVEKSDQEKKIHLLREFDPLGDPDSSVPDPYYDGIDRFDEVFHIVKRSCYGLFSSLEEGDLNDS